MSVSWSNMFAERTSRMKASDIRELLKLTARPEIISLAGGLPAPELFPIDEYRRAFEWVLETQGQCRAPVRSVRGVSVRCASLLAARMTSMGIPAERRRGADHQRLAAGARSGRQDLPEPWRCRLPGEPELHGRHPGVRLVPGRATSSCRWTTRACAADELDAILAARRRSSSSTRCRTSRTRAAAR